LNIGYGSHYWLFCKNKQVNLKKQAKNKQFNRKKHKMRFIGKLKKQASELKIKTSWQIRQRSQVSKCKLKYPQIAPKHAPVN